MIAEKTTEEKRVTAKQDNGGQANTVNRGEREAGDECDGGLEGVGQNGTVKGRCAAGKQGSEGTPPPLVPPPPPPPQPTANHTHFSPGLAVAPSTIHHERVTGRLMRCAASNKRQPGSLFRSTCMYHELLRLGNQFLQHMWKCR